MLQKVIHEKSWLMSKSINPKVNEQLLAEGTKMWLSIDVSSYQEKSSSKNDQYRWDSYTEKFIDGKNWSLKLNDSCDIEQKCSLKAKFDWRKAKNDFD